jgi:hypothetical protein
MPRFENPRDEKFWEVEQVGDTVETCDGKPDAAKPPRIKVAKHENEDEARHAAGQLVMKKLRRGWKAAGPSRYCGGGDGFAPPPPPSALALDEYFAAGAAQFVPELLRATAASKLAALAERWYKDPRPWAREALLAYIDDGCDRPLHKGLVKRLFKAAEAKGDDEAMAHFMVAFDRLGRRALVKRVEYSWDRATRTTTSKEHFELVQDEQLPGRLVQADRKKKAKESPVFSRATRRYLARRAYRYFRMLGHRDVARYGKAMRLALPLYQDAHLSTVSKLLDAWGLLHALYAWSPVIDRAPSGIRLAEGKSLSELVPAPHFPDAWKGVFSDLIGMASTAGCRTVRAWAVSLLRTQHADDLAKLAFADVKRLVMSPHDEPLVLGAELLAKLKGLETLPLAEWLELLSIENLDVLPGIATLAERLLAPARLSLDQCIALATGKTAPVAALGLSWAKTKPIAKPTDLAAIARLARAGVPTVRDEGTKWATGVIAAHPLTTAEHVRDLCDGPFADARAHALAIVAGEKFAAQPALWFALTESPYDDVRTFVLANAAAWREQATPSTLRHVWTTALLAVHTGSAAKAKVPRQIAERIAGHPDEARALLPVLGFALRSVRPAERALGLAALVRAVRGDEQLRALSRELLPELVVTEQVTS